MNLGSKTTPKIFEFLSKGTGELKMLVAGWQLEWLVYGVKRVIENFSGAMVSLYSWAQS